MEYIYTCTFREREKERERGREGDAYNVDYVVVCCLLEVPKQLNNHNLCVFDYCFRCCCLFYVVVSHIRMRTVGIMMLCLVS